MRSKVMKCVSIAALLATLMFWSSAVSYQLVLRLVVSIAATVLVVEAIQARKYGWVAGFGAVALLFNPAVPVFGLSGVLSFVLVVLSIAPFAISLVAWKTQPLLSMPSITDRNPGSESL